MSSVVFFIAAIAALGGAAGVIVLRNPLYSVLSLVVHLIALAALFLLLRAEFVAAAQVVVYAGAVMVLYVFVVAYIGGSDEPLGRQPGRAGTVGAWLCCGALAVELMIAVLGSGLKAIDSHGAPYSSGFGSPGAIGDLLLTKFLAPFEIASYLLLIAAVGAVVLARRRRGLPDEHDDDLPTVSAKDILMPSGAGSMAEAVGRMEILTGPEERA
jgi:NADH:ubiquinone oxidoreductase subunit 6 (subunit J)